MSHRIILLVFLLSGLWSTAVMAQQSRFLYQYRSFETGTTGTPVPVMEQHDNTGRMVLGGLGLGAVGLAGGAALGYAIARQGCDDDEWFCGWGGMAISGLSGVSFGIPLGTHLGNRRQGNLERAMLASLGVGGVGLLAAVAAGDSAGPIIVAVPVVQLVVSISIELKTGR